MAKDDKTNIQLNMLQPRATEKTYTFNAAEAWTNDLYGLLFDAERIHLNGEKVDQATYASNFTIVQNRETGNEVTPCNLTVTYWESVLGGGSKAAWSVLPGARVKLAKDKRIGELTIADSSDVKIDLNGFRLTVSSLFVDGEKLKGAYTAATLPSVLTGEGTLVVGGNGFAVIVR